MADERILIVDDEPHIVRLCTQILEEEGYVVQGAGTAEGAMSYLRSEPWDLLLVDIRMPGTDGLALLRQARHLDPTLTGVVITGYATMDRAIEALNSGARGFVLKPFGVEELILAVETAFAQQEKEQERLRLRVQLPILEIGQALMAEGKVEPLGRRLLDVVVRDLDAVAATLMMLDEKESRIHLFGTASWHGPLASEIPFPEGGSILGQALEAEKPLILDARSGEQLPSAWRSFLLHTDDDVVALVPLRTMQKQLGVLSLTRRSTQQPAAAFPTSDLTLLSIIGSQIATALENAQLYAVEKERIAALARALEQQQELDRLKSQFIQNVSHELRTPLSMILGYVELLAAGELGDMPEDQMSALRVVLQRAHVLRDLVENITALLVNEARETAPQLVPFSELVRSTVTDFQELATRAGLTLRADIPPTSLTVLGDADHLRRVVDNLISNALKFTPAGGMVTVHLASENGRLVLRVSDTGIGIPDDYRDRVFERFFQVDGTTTREHGGSGLGLALVKEIVERHSGTVHVESRIGEGTTIVVRLPLEPASLQTGNDG